MSKFRTGHFKFAASAAVIAVAISAVPADVVAQAADDEIIVTATRRAASVQDIPLNIAAVSATELEDIGITDLAELSSWVPGFHIVNGGGREQDGLIIRGLNADGLGAANGNGTVATYIGEIPLLVDLKLNDMKQVEVLLGPQGTLYGAGTMGGAIRYIPNKPEIGGELFELRGDTYFYSAGDGLSTDVGFTANVPVTDSFAVRISLDHLADDGYIDYTRAVQQIGFSNPDPDLNDPADVAANLRTVEDANKESTMSFRVAGRWVPTVWLDATLTYYGQFQDVEGRSQNGFLDGRAGAAFEPFATGEYETYARVLEPNKRDDQLLALEVIADLGFAELTSATGYAEYDELGNRDQTDLLIGLQYSYESFPSFTAITEEAVRQKIFNQEVRLVSTGDSALSWIIGAFYNETETQSYSHEFTFNHPFSNRPDDLEYDAFSNSLNKEQAIFGEIGYQITEDWQVTLGGRYYEYDLKSVSDAVVPFFAAPTYQQSTLDSVEALAFDPVNDAKDDGTLFKFNTSYAVNEDINVYGTISEGFRLGGSNGIAPCPAVLPTTQILCALPDEANFGPDTTTNYEVGVKSQWMDGALTLNGALFYIDWEGILLAGATANGQLPILQNGGTAASRGIELLAYYSPTDQLNIRANYSYTNAELTSPAPDLYNESAFFDITAAETGGQDGDRLPGSPEHQFSVFGDYTQPLTSGNDLVYRLGVSYTGDVLQRVGSIANGETLDSYTMVNGSVSYAADNWTLTLYANNLLDTYAEGTITGTSASVQFVSDSNGGQHLFRGLKPTPLPPRVIGLRANYRFD